MYYIYNTYYGVYNTIYVPICIYYIYTAPLAYFGPFIVYILHDWLRVLKYLRDLCAHSLSDNRLPFVRCYTRVLQYT